MHANLKNWLIKNKIVASESEELSDVIIIDNIGKFLHVQHKDNKIIDEEFAFILYDEELDIIEDKVVDFILFEFGKRFYYSKINVDKNKYGEQIYKPDFFDFKGLGNTSDETVVDFAHLGVHDEYEMLNGTSNTELWCKKAKFLGHKSLGVCNKNTLSSLLSFQTSCQKYGIKPIIGETITVAVDYEEDKNIQETFELKLFVMNETGWKNLLRINKAINVEFKKFIPSFMLDELGEGLCCVIPKNSEFNYHIDDILFCKKIIKRFKRIFDTVYYQIDTVEYNSVSLFKEHLSKLDAYLINFTNVLEPILINDSYYLDEDDYPVKSLLNKVSGKAEAESRKQYYKDFEQTLKSYEEWEEVEPLYENILLGIQNAVELADSIEFKIPTGERKLPLFEVEDVEYLFYEQIEVGLQKKLGHLTEQELEPYLKQIEVECDLIVPNGLCDYFMIVADITGWCHKNKILVGSGRGSVCGSLVAYLLDVTSVDPLKYGLMFERFLNATRVSGERAKSNDSIPDVDLDFPTEHRDSVKNYIKEKYGEEFTCSIATFSRMKLKTCIKDFAKVKGIPFELTNKITKDIDDQIEYTWGDIFYYGCKSKVLFQFIQDYPEIVHATKSALMHCKAESVHPSAVVIVPKFDSRGKSYNTFEWMPVKQIDGVLVSEWEGKYIDKSGFLKEDILGLSQLDKFDAMMKLIKKNQGVKINLNKIPFDDKDVFKYFKKGWNEDVFQFGTTGLMNYCRQVKPDTLNDLIAMTALFRPGPMESNTHQEFVDIKNGKKKPSFDKGMEEITKETYSLYVYQEQIMKAMVVGSLSEVQSDIARTAIKKKDFKTLDAFKEQFIKGYSEIDGEKKAIEIWDKLLAFSNYGFNKSHAAAYSIMSYWSQWFKVNYPLEFWTTSFQFAKETEIPFRMSELNKTGVQIEIRPPDVNFSDSNFTCDYQEQRIFFSLTKIKGCGEVAVTHLIEERKKGGKFFDFDEFVSRVPSKVNKSNIVNLIISGAFDLIENIKYPKNRKYLLERYLLTKKCELPEIYTTPESETNTFWIGEQKVLTGYGEIDYVSLIETKVASKRLSSIYKEAFEVLTLKEGAEVAVAGKVIVANENNTKKGKMGRLTIDNNNTTILVSIWPDVWQSLGYTDDDLFGKVIVINGNVKMDTYKGQKCIFSNNKTKIHILS